MPHLSFEYSRGLGQICDLDAFAAVCRDALVATGACPLGGIRVRGFEADVQALLALGYNERDAKAALKALPADVGVAEGIKLALKALSR